MKYSCFGIVGCLLLLWLVDAQNSTNIYNKTKRNLSRDIQSYGDSSLVVPLASNMKIYYEPKPTNMYYQAKPLALVDLSQPVKVIEPKVAAEHVLYEFQQTPTDSISNVHVKQLFEQDLKPPPPLPSNNSPNGIMTSETIVTPAQHNAFVQNHVQPFNIKQHPLYNVQSTFVEPKKYVYGKIIVDSTHPQPNYFPQNPSSFHSSQQFIPHGHGQQFIPHGHGQQFVPQGHTVQFSHSKPIVSYVNHFPRNNVPRSEQLITTNPQTQFRPPPISHHQAIDTPIHVEKPQNQKPRHRPVEKPLDDEKDDVDEEETEEKLEYENDHDEYESPFEKYFDEEDEELHKDRDNFEEIEEEAEGDNKRGSSSYSKTNYYPKKQRKPKKQKPNKYPDDKYFKNDKYKSYKYKHAKKSKYPRSELDGRFSENIPITHKKKILKEQWYLSKSLGDKYEK